jgi:hypothetical protein
MYHEYEGLPRHSSSVGVDISKGGRDDSGYDFLQFLSEV